jgi:hypothetical protein
MLKITTHSEGERITLKVEGRLAGPWVEELKTCWAQASGQHHRVEVVLNEVTYIDEGGKKLLAEMHRKGVQLAAAGCMTRAIIEGILRGEIS